MLRLALAALALLTYVVDFGAGVLGAKHFGAFIGEFSVQRRLVEAGRAGLGATLGLALGVAAKLALAFAMLAVFATVRFMM